MLQKLLVVAQIDTPIYPTPRSQIEMGHPYDIHYKAQGNPSHFNVNGQNYAVVIYFIFKRYKDTYKKTYDTLYKPGSVGFYS